MSKVWSDKEFWSRYWDKEKRKTTEFLFTALMEEYIDFKKIHSYMEIGGAPGVIMAYMNQTYGMEVSAIDFVDKKYIEEVMKKNAVTDYNIYEEDFTKFNVKEHKRRYSFVASWGFIEHFDIHICKKIIQNQKELVEENGYLIIELPNIRKFNWMVYRICNNELLKIHNLKVMNLKFLKEQVQMGNQFDILYCDYYLTSFFEFNPSSEFFDRHKNLKKLFRGIHKIAKKLHIDNIKTSFFSPYIVLIATRKSPAFKP